MTDKNEELLLPVIDIELGTALAGGKEPLARELLELLRSNLSTERLAIETAYLLNNFEEVTRLVHRLHGAVCYCGLPQLKKATFNLETALKKKEYAHIEPLYHEFIAAILRVEAANL